jgi:hypothetical protein
MGPYCKFCDRRCFVDRVMPYDATWRPGEAVILATCPRGMEHSRETTGGYDAEKAINPFVQPAYLRGYLRIPTVEWDRMVGKYSQVHFVENLRSAVEEARDDLAESEGALAAAVAHAAKAENDAVTR